VINIPQINSDGVLCLKLDGFVDHKLVLIERRSSDFIGPVEPQNQNIDDEPVELENEGSELQSHQQPIEVGMVHIFEIDHHIVLGCHVVSDIVVDDQSQQSVEKG